MCLGACVRLVACGCIQVPFFLGLAGRGCMWPRVGARGCVAACGCVRVHLVVYGSVWVRVGACGCARVCVHAQERMSIEVHNAPFGTMPGGSP